MCFGVPWTSFHCQPRSAQTPSVQQQCGASRRSDSRTACSGVVELSARSMTGSISAAIARMPAERSEEHTSELQSLMRISYAVFCLKKKKTRKHKESKLKQQNI